MAGTGQRDDPFAAFNFLIDIDGYKAGFSEISGLDLTTDPIEYRNGNEDIRVRKLPGLKKFSNITLKRGYTADKGLWQWRLEVMNGKTKRRAGSITLLNEERKPVMEWTFKEGWPSKWSGPAFNAKNNEVAIETLEIVCESIELV